MSAKKKSQSKKEASEVEERHTAETESNEEEQTSTEQPAVSYAPSAQPTTPSATGLEDYAYWWKTTLKEQSEEPAQSESSFRRGRIWT